MHHLVEKEMGRCGLGFFKLISVEWILPPFNFFFTHTHRQSCIAILRELAASTHAQNLRKREKGRTREKEGKEGAGEIKRERQRLYMEVYRMPTVPFALSFRF